MENTMFDLTKYENIIALFALVLVITFASAAFLDNRWKKAAPRREFGSDDNPDSRPKSAESDGKDVANDLYTHEQI
jgi:hypothetical protein